MTAKTLLILNGPGLAGHACLGSARVSDIKAACIERCDALGMELSFKLSDDMDSACRLIAGETEKYDALILNPAVNAHTADDDIGAFQAAIEAIVDKEKPVIEVRMGNLFRSEAAAHPLQVPSSGLGLVCGLGVSGYLLAIEAAHRRLLSSA